MCVILTKRHPSQEGKDIALTSGGKILYWNSHTEAYRAAPPGYVALEASSLDDMARFVNAPSESFLPFSGATWPKLLLV